jgi:hypothetical protein
MKGLRFVLGLGLAVVLSALAFPAAAAEKLFSISASTYTGAGVSTGGVIPAGNTPSVVLIDFFNQSPPNTNSVFKSIQLLVPGDVSYRILTASSKTVNGGSCPLPPTNPPAPNTTSSTITLSNLTGVKVGGHYCLYLSVTTNATSCTAVSWNGQANTGTGFGGGQPFFNVVDQTNPVSTAYTTDGCTGILGCGQTTGDNLGGTYSAVAFGSSVVTNGSPGFGIGRGSNTDGNACVLVPYQFTLDQTNQIANFSVTNKGTQKLAVEYFILWPAIAVNTDVDVNNLPTGWTIDRPRVSWGIDTPDPSPGSIDFVPALACTTAPTTLVGLQPDELAALLPVIPNVAPYSDDTQTHAQFKPGIPAKVCIAQQGWTAVGLDTDGNTLVQYWVKVIDQADSWIIH